MSIGSIFFGFIGFIVMIFFVLAIFRFIVWSIFTIAKIIFGLLVFGTLASLVMHFIFHIPIF
ncbi:hypothetical protein C4M98_04505 [Mycoplasmopsis pullorum]|nr:hypothetical protein C4M94_00105 [Mycoplasmopsis pullorum]TNK83453.1 hypothetical protein C4M80_00270 [Mycoplasmopsis pullorum]TNK85181.1 hypothetical protein C4M81_00205 [Mycoplasmopsis pullorum]TNK85682.1 hypothetical protein C4M92_00550 [Mycoplasmopsis pullorum]TNK86113.1 hypothetical protein C4M85_01240 [Mycoplasmopsis pullorum]